MFVERGAVALTKYLLSFIFPALLGYLTKDSRATFRKDMLNYSSMDL